MALLFILLLVLPLAPRLWMSQVLWRVLKLLDTLASLFELLPHSMYSILMMAPVWTTC